MDAEAKRGTHVYTPCCESCACHKEKESDNKIDNELPRGADIRRILRTARLCAGAALFAAALIFVFPYWLEFAMFLLSYVLVGGEVVLRAAKSIMKGRVFNENFLMSVATISAFAIGEFPEGVAVMLFYQAGELLQNIAVGRSRRSIAALMDIRPDYANVKSGDRVRRISPEEARAGDVIIVRPGEKIPLDGRVVEGRSSLDTSALTGESAPRDVGPGDEALAGTVNHNGLLTIEVTKPYGESTLSKVLDLVQNAASKKAPVENFITRFSRYYTPAVVFAALALAVLPPMFIPGAAFEDYIYRALVFLMVSCPCALVISVPLGFFGGIGGASRKGILIKGSNYLEALTKADTMVFDKTGTLTKGVFKVTDVVSAGAINKEELLGYAALAEAYSNHPIAVSIREAYPGSIDAQSIAGYEELPGRGVRANSGGRALLVGNAALMEQEDIDYKKADAAGTAVYLAVDGRFAGYILISDEVKPDGRRAIEQLKRAGIKRMVMLTGDSLHAAKITAKELGIDEFYAQLLPHEKVEKLEQLENGKSAGSKIAFVGDGVNDAPALARADIGIAMGGAGSDAAIEAADIVLMTDEPFKIAQAVRAARRTKSIVRQNIIFALAVKAAILALGAAGITTMWEAVFGDVGVALIAVLNSARAIRMK